MRTCGHYNQIVFRNDLRQKRVTRVIAENVYFLAHGVMAPACVSPVMVQVVERIPASTDADVCNVTVGRAVRNCAEGVSNERSNWVGSAVAGRQ